MPLLAAEIGLRVLVAADRLPFADSHRDDFEITWANLERSGTPDILILGDSVSKQGIEPNVLDGLARQAAGSNISVFNAASLGGGLGVNAAIVEELAAQGRLPRVVVVGVASGTLSTDITFRESFSRTVMGRLFAGCGVRGAPGRTRRLLWQPSLDGLAMAGPSPRHPRGHRRAAAIGCTT